MGLKMNSNRLEVIMVDMNSEPLFTGNLSMDSLMDALNYSLMDALNYSSLSQKEARVVKGQAKDHLNWGRQYINSIPTFS